MSFALAVGQRSGTPFPGLARLFWTPSRQAGARGPVTGFATWTCSRSTTAFRDSGADRTSTRTCNFYVGQRETGERQGVQRRVAARA